MRKSGHKALTLVVNSDAGEIDINDLSGLPDELRRELSVSQVDILERQILDVFRTLGGSADLDHVLIGLYRKFHIVEKRRVLQNKLWRMVRKGQIQKPKSARGLFRLETPKPRKGRRQ